MILCDLGYHHHVPCVYSYALFYRIHVYVKIWCLYFHEWRTSCGNQTTTKIAVCIAIVSNLNMVSLLEDLVLMQALVVLMMYPSIQQMRQSTTLNNIIAPHSDTKHYLKKTYSDRNFVSIIQLASRSRTLADFDYSYLLYYICTTDLVSRAQQASRCSTPPPLLLEAFSCNVDMLFVSHWLVYEKLYRS